MAQPPAASPNWPGASGSFTTSELQSLVGSTPLPALRAAIRTQIDRRIQAETAGKERLRLTPEQERPLNWAGRPTPGDPCQLAVTGGVQSGKSLTLSLDMLSRLPWLGPTPLWVVGPDYFQTRHERAMLTRFLRLQHWLDERQSVLPKAQNEPWALRTVFGSVIYGMSSSKPETLAGESPSYIGMAEAGQQTQETFEILRARATARAAHFLLAGTLERSQPWFRRLTQRWTGGNAEGGHTFVLPSWANPAFYPGGRWDPKMVSAERDLPPDVFLQRHGGVPAPPQGLVFREFNALTHGRGVRWGVPPPDADPWTAWLPKDLDVEIAIDPGYLGSAYAVLAVAEYGGQVLVCDEVHVRGMIHQQVIATCQARPWWPQVTGGVIDLAGTQHAMGGEPAVEVWRAPLASGGAALKLRWNRVPLWQGTDRLHLALRDDPVTDAPTLQIDPDRCPRLVWELTEGYRYRTASDGEILGEKPHDAANDGVKALSYWLYDRFGPLGAPHGVKHGTGARIPFSWEATA